MESLWMKVVEKAHSLTMEEKETVVTSLSSTCVLISQNSFFNFDVSLNFQNVLYFLDSMQLILTNIVVHLTKDETLRPGTEKNTQLLLQIKIKFFENTVRFIMWFYEVLF
jgi:hypothetical protein